MSDPDRLYRILPQPPFTPQIGALVEMMNYARSTTLQAVRDLSVDELDAVPPGFSNSIGMLLAHVAATDRLYQTASFEGVDPYETEVYAPFVGAMSFGKDGARVQGRTLEELLAQLAEVREETLRQFAARDDAWLQEVMTAWDDFRPNQHWAWFHVMEDEVSHRGQIRVIRNALRAARG